MAAVATGQDNQDGSLQPTTPPALRHRVSMEEDYFYQELMTNKSSHRLSRGSDERPPTRFGVDKGGELVIIQEEEPLPEYSCDLEAEGVFNMKMEIEDTIKRAEARNWHSVYVELRGTALSIYHVKKDWGLNRTVKSGPNVSPDNPPWVKKGSLEKTYTLLHADVGIAADYQKRRYVIRVRAETDQFLLSCIELPNFVKWLDILFAAINIAPALDERDFPRDQSIPRAARLRYFRGEDTTRQGGGGGSDGRRPAPVIHHSAMTPRIPPPPDTPPSSDSNLLHTPRTRNYLSEPSSSSFVPHQPSQPPLSSLEPLPSRLSTTSYPNSDIQPETGKWRPRHEWTTAHDMVYAKLCYAVLLFRSPRKSNYVIAKGKKWFVDWTTGRMIRVLPPAYFDHELTGPFQVWSAENRRI
ncbi:hypothetical protein BX600DRAFT_434884 [Xylariales sp. PMI_506]|nr:hypothetical protein BX600DRAFT_434884 [Xylariales sp. PMI_506]